MDKEQEPTTQRPRRNRTTPQQKFASRAVLREDGHTGWTGRRATNGAPAVRQGDRSFPASHVAFQSRAGRPPVGHVKPECGYPNCLTGEHLSDDIERRKVRGQERALYGLDPVPWDVCPKGRHSWDAHGRFEPDLTPYCQGCNTDRVRAGRKAAA